MNPTKSESAVSANPAASGRRDSLTITDNRNGRQYEVPIKHDTIRAMTCARSRSILPTSE
jgi:hypothetical protein